MSASPDRSAAESPSFDAFLTAQPHRRSVVGPWLVLLLLWGLATALLIFGAETATLIAAGAN